MQASSASATPAATTTVLTPMTNSRLTDLEILEARFPVRLERFALGRGSGGVVRQLRVPELITLATLVGSRRVAPFGLAGGGGWGT
jgi:5-oxoprolinase (ATP-hydrolysing)